VKKLIFFIIMSVFLVDHNTSFAQNTDEEVKEIKFELLGGDYFFNKCKIIQPHDILNNLNDSISFKYPSIDKDTDPLYYMALKIDDSTTLTTINIYEFPTKVGITQSIKTYPEDSQILNVNEVCPKHVLLGIAPGMLFLEKRTDIGTWFIQNYLNHSFESLYEGNQFPKFYQVANKNSRNHLFFSVPQKNGVFEIHNKKMGRSPIISGNIISFDQFKNLFLINNYNTDDNADISLLSRQGGDTKNYSIAVHDKIEAYYPQFSQTGKYLAYIQNREQNRSVWDLVVKEISSKNEKLTFKTITTIKDINIYHMKVTAFFYEGTFQWIDDILFYQTKGNGIPHISAFVPKKNTYWKFSPNVKNKLIANHLDRTLIVHLSKICLFNIARKNGKWHIISECLLKLYEEKKFTTLERRRIAIFREK